MTTQHTPGWFTDEQRAEHERAYQQVLIDRYKRGLPLSKSDKREARKLIADIAKAEGR